MSVTRRRFLVGTAGLAAYGFLQYPAEAAEFTYKLGHDQPATHPQHLRVVEAAKKIAEETSGRLVVQIYPNSQLGSDPQMLSQVRSGALELVQMGDVVIGDLVPVASLAGLPFAFATPADLWKAMDGDLGRYIHAEIEKKLGLHVFEKGWDAGVRHVFTSERPVHTAADMKGLKLRLPSAALALSMFKCLGASPTQVPSAEVYTALQTHLVDGAEGPLVTIENSKYYEVSKYISLTSHMNTPFEMLANGKAWKRLPPDLQEVLSRNLNATAMLERQDIATGDEQLKARLTQQGQQFITPDRASFLDTLRRAGMYASWRDTYGGAKPFSLVEQVSGPLI